MAEAGGYSLDELIRQADRGAAVTAVSKGVVRVVEDLHAARRVDAIAAMGGGAGTTVGTAAMRAAARDSEGDGVHAGERRRAGIRRRQGHRDDPGDRRHQRAEPDQPRRVCAGRGAVCGMLDAAPDASAASPDAPLIAASMFGNTTPCVERARVLEAQGYELLVFHATGTGGQTMEGLIEAGQISGVLDVTTTEWADELVGGVMSAGPHRLEAAARTARRPSSPGMPGHGQLLGAGSPPAHVRAGGGYQHNAKQTLVRTTPEENVQLGEIIASKLNGSTGPVAVYLPLRGRLGDLRRREAVPLARGGPGPVRHAEVAAPARHSCREMDCHINDAPFADAMARHLLAMCGSVTA